MYGNGIVNGKKYYRFKIFKRFQDKYENQMVIKYTIKILVCKHSNFHCIQMISDENKRKT